MDKIQRISLLPFVQKNVDFFTLYFSERKMFFNDLVSAVCHTRIKGDISDKRPIPFHCIFVGL